MGDIYGDLMPGLTFVAVVLVGVMVSNLRQEIRELRRILQQRLPRSDADEPEFGVWTNATERTE
jgi:hypothetical protein